VYDVTKAETFANAKRWMEELKASAEPDCVIYLVGNQVDRVEINPSFRQVPTDQAA
jgi:GTPase SAR1 family protein